jgi:hypothetical protein
MPDLLGGQNWLPASRLIGEIDQPTDAKSLMAPFAGNPQQMYEFLMHPDNQAQMAHFGVHFNPQTIQQSPFFSNMFMGQHPGLGGRLSNAMSNMAMTPEAPMVSGAGSGISRAMQGMMGGPEMQRQYQMKQLMAPMQQMGAAIPPMEFQRKQQLLGGMLGSMQSGEQVRGEEEQRLQQKQQQEDAFKLQQLRQQGDIANQRIAATRPTSPGWVYQGEKTQVGPSQPTQTQGMPGMAAPTGPPSLTQTEGGWKKDLTYQGPVDAAKARYAGAATQRGKPTPKNFEDLETQKARMYEALEKEYAPFWNPSPAPNSGMDQKTWDALKTEKRNELEQRKQAIENYYSQGRNMLGAPVPTYGYPGQQAQQPSSMMAPGAGGSQAGQFPPDAVVDEEGNVWDVSGTQFLGKQ